MLLQGERLTRGAELKALAAKLDFWADKIGDAEPEPVVIAVTALVGIDNDLGDEIRRLAADMRD